MASDVAELLDRARRLRMRANDVRGEVAALYERLDDLDAPTHPTRVGADT